MLLIFITHELGLANQISNKQNKSILHYSNHTSLIRFLYASKAPKYTAPAVDTKTTRKIAPENRALNPSSYPSPLVTMPTRYTFLNVCKNDNFFWFFSLADSIIRVFTTSIGVVINDDMPEEKKPTIIVSHNPTSSMCWIPYALSNSTLTTRAFI